MSFLLYILFAGEEDETFLILKVIAEGEMDDGRRINDTIPKGNFIAKLTF